MPKIKTQKKRRGRKPAAPGTAAIRCSFRFVPRIDRYVRASSAELGVPRATFIQAVLLAAEQAGLNAAAAIDHFRTAGKVGFADN